MFDITNDEKLRDAYGLTKKLRDICQESHKQ